jgi:hypothetical protein
MSKTHSKQKGQRKTLKKNRFGKTRSNRKSHSSSTHKQIHSNANIVKTFLEMLNMIKLYHWKTKSYAQHKATDELYSSLSSSVDTFVEVLMGKDESRIHMIEKQMNMYDFSNIADFKDRIYAYRDFLINMSNHLDPRKDTDLLNIRDEMLGHINKFLYLLTLS